MTVLQLPASDLSARQIGEKLFPSPNTIRSHTRSVYRKLAVNPRADAVARAETLGLLPRGAESNSRRQLVKRPIVMRIAAGPAKSEITYLNPRLTVSHLRAGGMLSGWQPDSTN